MKKNTYLLFSFLIMACACNKKEETFDNPYEGGKAPLGVNLNIARVPQPANGAAGTVVKLAATGLLPYKDKVVFMFNGAVAEILSITESEITVKVPETASTGATSISVNDQVFFGPQFKVDGKVSIDFYYKATTGANSSVESSLKLADGRYILVGVFNNFDNKGGVITPTNRIVLTSRDGEVDRSFRFGNGAGGSVYSIILSPDAKNFYLGGGFSNYEKLNRFINNITRTTANGAGDSVRVLTYNKKSLGVPAFNGGTNGQILKLFNFNNKIVAVGAFQYYLKRRYDQPAKPYTFINGVTGQPVTVTLDSVIVDSTAIGQVALLNPDGSLDQSYHFNTAANKGYEGGNGFIQDAYMQKDSKLILTGSFNRFDNAAANYIVRLNVNGTVDNTFNIGPGADGPISSITFNETTKKFLLTGTFGKFNGVTVNSMVMLNEDGSIDNSFVAKDFDGGFPAFARQISNGMIVVSGSFKRYNSLRRAGFIILDAKGNLAPGYNTAGDFAGNLNDVVEMQNPDGKMALLLLGGVSRFDGNVVNNITRIVLEQ